MLIFSANAKAKASLPIRRRLTLKFFIMFVGLLAAGIELVTLVL
jgi:hypothetical protein